MPASRWPTNAFSRNARTTSQQRYNFICRHREFYTIIWTTYGQRFGKNAQRTFWSFRSNCTGEAFVHWLKYDRKNSNSSSMWEIWSGWSFIEIVLFFLLLLLDTGKSMFAHQNSRWLLLYRIWWVFDILVWWLTFNVNKYHHFSKVCQYLGHSMLQTALTWAFKWLKQ